MGRVLTALVPRPEVGPEPKTISAWRTGAQGERVLGHRLDEWAASGVGVVLHDRRIAGTRANIDEFTVTTARALERVGGAERGKAIIVLNPAEPALIMRDTVLCLVDDVDHNAVRQAVETMVADVAAYVPGYRLKQAVQVTRLGDDDPLHTLSADLPSAARWKISVFLEVAGAGHYLPPYAGNLDIMTSAALRVGERLAARRPAEVAP